METMEVGADLSSLEDAATQGMHSQSLDHQSGSMRNEIVSLSDVQHSGSVMKKEGFQVEHIKMSEIHCNQTVDNEISQTPILEVYSEVEVCSVDISLKEGGDRVLSRNPKSSYSLRPRKEIPVEDGREIEGRLAVKTSQTSTVGRKSFMSIAKKKASKEVSKGKQLTINRVLRVEKTRKMVSK
jgi:hypothetical protein